MKEIDELPALNANKLFETPQKKDRPLKKCSQLKPAEAQHLDPNHKFDLGQSPRFKVTTDIQIDQNQSSAKQPVSYSVKKEYYSPSIVVKIQNNPQSSINKFINSNKMRRKIRMSFRQMKLKENFQKCYADILKKIQQNLQVEIPLAEIISPQNQEENIYSQLLTFTLNPKNSRKLTYCKSKHTLVPLYECLGCSTPFANSPALGGHLRSCTRKTVHYKMLDMYHKACQSLVQNSSESIDLNEIKKHENVMSSNLKTPLKNPQMIDQKINQLTEKQKEAPSIFCSSEEKSISKSVQGSDNNFDHNGEKFENQDSDQDEGCREDSEEYNPSEEKTVKKPKMARKEKMESKYHTKHKRIEKNRAQKVMYE